MDIFMYVFEDNNYIITKKMSIKQLRTFEKKHGKLKYKEYFYTKYKGGIIGYKNIYNEN